MFNIIFVLIGTIIGAGFISGKEVFIFFNIYGKYGLLGLILAMVIISLSIYKAIKIILDCNITTYKAFLEVIFWRFPFFSSVFDNIINIFLLVSFIVMVSGFSTCFVEMLGISSLVGLLLIAFLSFSVFIHKAKALVTINRFFIPCLIFLLIPLAIKDYSCLLCYRFNFLNDNLYWLISSFFYASYNLIIIFPIIISLQDFILDLKQAKMISIFVLIFLLSIAIVLFFLMNFHFNEITFLDFPTIYIVSGFSLFYKHLFFISILGAIFTTAISSGYSLLNNLNISNKHLYSLFALSLCIISIITSNFGFSNLISLLYPILGFIGLIQVVFVLFY